MERSQIETLFNSRRYAEVLSQLPNDGSSAWDDTVRLRCLRAMGDRDSAIEKAQSLFELIDNQATPYSLSGAERDEQLRYIALVFSEFGRAEQACTIMQSLCDAKPNIAALHREYAFALNNCDKLDDAEAQLKTALSLQPNNASSYAQLARLFCRTGRIQEGLHNYSRAATLEPNNATYTQRLVYWSNYAERTTQRSNFQLARLWASKAFPANQAGTNTWRTADPDKTLKIGFVSADFCAHAVSFFITPLLKGLQSQNSYHVTAYSNTHKPDHITETIKPLCDVWRDCAQQNDKALAAQISADQIDILIDLNGHTSGNRLAVFSKHVAPIQMNWLGYPSTTGLKSIGYRITDSIADPEDLHDDFYSEQLLRLPNGFLCYQPLATAPDIAQIDDNDAIRFGSFNNLAKLSSQTYDAWAAAMHAVPNSTLYLKRQQLIHENARAHVINEFAERGIDQSRLSLKTSKAKIEQHLNEYNAIDIALDSSPYNGTTTTLEALWMGVPVISLSGNTHASRVSHSILHRLNLGGLACGNVREFANKAKELSDNAELRQTLRNSLRDTMRNSSLMNEQQFTQEFTTALRQQWHQWCHQRNIEEGLEAPNNALLSGVTK